MARLAGRGRLSQAVLALAVLARLLLSGLQAIAASFVGISRDPSAARFHARSRYCGSNLGATSNGGAAIAARDVDDDAWDTTLSQEEFMLRDMCIQVDEDDNAIGPASKKDAHSFSKEAPRAQLHRAFSVFLFDSQDRLLLQQRAGTKITFPSTWTNTCCSHQLSGFQPTEVDTQEDVAAGQVKGTKRAAIRKLNHELGIPTSSLDINKFKFLTRVHYWAADVVTHGPDSVWGEHEIDYLLIYRADDDLEISPNPEEVDDYRWVTMDELSAMMKPDTGLLWSPWFRIIAEGWLATWWANLSEALSTDLFVDVEQIHRFDPGPEHMGGAGQAGPWLGAAEKTLATTPA